MDLETSLFSLHRNIYSDNEQILFNTFEKMCDMCLLEQAKHLYETRIKFLEEYDEDDFLDIFYVLFLRQHIEGANYSLESEMITWYFSILEEKQWINFIDPEEIVNNIFDSDNHFMFRVLRNLTIFNKDYTNSISWNIIHKKYNKNLLDEITNTTNFDAQFYNTLFLCVCQKNEIDELPSILKFCNNPDCQMGIDKLCYNQCFESILHFMNEWKVIPTYIGFFNSCTNCIKIVDFLYNKLIISNEHCLKGIQISCEANKPEIAKYLLNKYTKQINKNFIANLCITVCKVGHIEILLLLFDRFPIDFLTYNLPYNCACKRGHLNILKFIDERIIKSKDNQMFDPIINDETFEKICCRNHVNVLQYLLEKYYTFNFCNHYLFNEICKKNYFELAQIFVQQCPETYLVELNENNKIIRYSILQLLPISKDMTYVNEIQTCSVCHENNSDIITDCDHQFCYGCLNTWFNKHQSCPYCRTDFESCNKITISL